MLGRRSFFACLGAATTAAALPTIPATKKPARKITPYGSWVCECGYAMVVLPHAPKAMICTNPQCKYGKDPVSIPMFTADAIQVQEPPSPRYFRAEKKGNPFCHSISEQFLTDPPEFDHSLFVKETDHVNHGWFKFGDCIMQKQGAWVQTYQLVDLLS